MYRASVTVILCADFFYFLKISPSKALISSPSYPPRLSLLQGSALGLDGVVDDATGPSREVHGNQGILRYTSLLGDVAGWEGGWGGGIQEGGGQRSNKPDTLTGA